MTLPGLTETQQRAFDFIRSEVAAGRLAPTLQELADHLGLRAKSGAHRIVAELKAKGHLRRSPGRKRAIVISADAMMYAVRLPNDVNRRLHDHIAAWAATPEAVIVTAVTEYLARQP
ncbi:LexA family protein [Methylobacterium sp. Leaf85]|uniref:LexA family protein n=1 Tax=Methylobacterium sp. Leaf85 TaxID=1736241 RepID=UPI0006FF1459|nr:MarR family transcriptional regulator [Methylobacterium sp. Leaf85]KQO53096.1 hypothetical protein ASF08_19420 [Methylobacterium sp. Leaf85]